MKIKLRRTMLATVLLAGIVLSTYAVFARAQANGKRALLWPKSTARGGAKPASAVFANTSGTTSPTPTANASYNAMANGSYVGARVYAYYGYVQVEVIVQNGQISNVRVLEHPNDNGTSQYINSIAMPYLVQEAVQAQSARVNLISGATLSSLGFVKSLNSAIVKAHSA